MEPMLQDALASLARYGNSFNRRACARGGPGTSVSPSRTPAGSRSTCSGSWATSPRSTPGFRPARGASLLLQVAGVDFGILYEAERNSGNDVRRVGEEGLFEELAEHNIERWAGAASTAS